MVQPPFCICIPPPGSRPSDAAAVCIHRSRVCNRAAVVGGEYGRVSPHSRLRRQCGVIEVVTAPRLISLVAGRASLVAANVWVYCLCPKRWRRHAKHVRPSLQARHIARGKQSATPGCHHPSHPAIRIGCELSESATAPRLMGGCGISKGCKKPRRTAKSPRLGYFDINLRALWCVRQIFFFTSISSNASMMSPSAMSL